MSRTVARDCGFFLKTRKRAFSRIRFIVRPPWTSVLRVIGTRLSLALIELQLRLSSARLCDVTVDSICHTGKHTTRPRPPNYRAYCR